MAVENARENDTVRSTHQISEWPGHESRPIVQITRGRWCRFRTWFNPPPPPLSPPPPPPPSPSLVSDTAPKAMRQLFWDLWFWPNNITHVVYSFLSGLNSWVTQPKMSSKICYLAKPFLPITPQIQFRYGPKNEFHVPSNAVYIWIWCWLANAVIRPYISPI